MLTNDHLLADVSGLSLVLILTACDTTKLPEELSLGSPLTCQVHPSLISLGSPTLVFPNILS